MKYIFPFFLITLSFYIYSCANQGTPTGGPKDTIPPLLIESRPMTQTVFYTGQEFNFVFDERIDVSKLKNSLIITPHTDNKYNIKIRKNVLTLRFESLFADSTTYTFNFGVGVTDITEKNPVKNLNIAFSTGPIIDSISIKGIIKNLYTDEKEIECLVGLYSINDSMNFINDKPRYFTKTNEDGSFIIENIKNDYYKIITFHDVNNNLKLDPETEAHGFLSDSLNLNISQDSISIPIHLMDANPFKMIRSKNTGKYFDIQYNKAVFSYDVKSIDTTSSLKIPPYNRIKQNTFIRFYPDPNYKKDIDSLAISITSFDTLMNKSIDTTYIKFIESSRKSKQLVYDLSPKENTKLKNTILNEIRFSKPIKYYNLDSILFQYDTLKTQHLVDSNTYWNENKTLLTFKSFLENKFLKTMTDSLLIVYSDTSRSDSIYLSKKAYYQNIKTNAINLNIPAHTFISIEDDSSVAIQHNYTFITQEQRGSVAGLIKTKYKHYTLQLVDKNYDVIEEIKNPTTFSFPSVKPGEYTFRLLIDNNSDGTWTFGNILQDIEPEEIYFYPEMFNVRANWELENIEISF
jgi:uncharacterized protein (DUF2141 family)